MRRFKAYAKRDTEMLSRVRDRDFWTWFLSPGSEPGAKGNQFKSYSEKHRLYLRSNMEFVNYMYEWFLARGKAAALKEYDDDPMRCCPWCTEKARRDRVHAGNVRTAKRHKEANQP